MKMHCKKAMKSISLALDSRLPATDLARLQDHLDACPACRDWQKNQAWLQAVMRTPSANMQPSSGFQAAVLARINKPGRQGLFGPVPAFRPLLLRTAMVMIMIFSALLGFFLGSRLDAPAGDPALMAFNRALNLDLYADLPAESFGAVYERLLEGDRK